MSSERTADDEEQVNMARTSKRQQDMLELDAQSIEVKRRARADVVISVRLSRDEADRLQRLARRSNKTLSQIAREAIVERVNRSAGAVAGTTGWTVTSSGMGPVTFMARDDGELRAYTAGDAREITARTRI
jgi:hypothetical protein